ncbi:hypothetical protein [Rhodococcus jostii]|uniref:hypothetical protein n=1 Tax=Rhodococcus jostii TaxID=132919 RepID=UPI0013C31ED6|nr:hypothetical protein [Rhodococcus jostii]
MSVKMRSQPAAVSASCWLKATGLEQLRDFFDRHHLGLILIGSPAWNAGSHATPSSTAASASPTNTGR